MAALEEATGVSVRIVALAEPVVQRSYRGRLGSEGFV